MNRSLCLEGDFVEEAHNASNSVFHGGSITFADVVHPTAFEAIGMEPEHMTNKCGPANDGITRQI